MGVAAVRAPEQSATEALRVAAADQKKVPDDSKVLSKRRKPGIDTKDAS